MVEWVGVGMAGPGARGSLSVEILDWALFSPTGRVPDMFLAGWEWGSWSFMARGTEGKWVGKSSLAISPFSCCLWLHTLARS